MAVLKVRSGDAWTTAFVPKIRSAGAWAVPAGKIRIAGAWEVFTGVVTLSGESITHMGVGAGTYTAAVIFRSVGIVEKKVDATTTQIDSATDWIVPTSHAPSDYEVKASLTSGPNPTNIGTFALDVWHPLTGDVTWERVTSNNEDSTVLVCSIRKGTGAVIDTGTYTLRAGQVV